MCCTLKSLKPASQPTCLTVYLPTWLGTWLGGICQFCLASPADVFLYEAFPDCNPHPALRSPAYNL